MQGFEMNFSANGNSTQENLIFNASELQITQLKNKIYRLFTSEKVKEFMSVLKMTELETLLYLWLYNHVSITPAERSQNFGREMYKKFAKAIASLLREY